MYYAASRSLSLLYHNTTEHYFSDYLSRFFSLSLFCFPHIYSTVCQFSLINVLYCTRVCTFTNLYIYRCPYFTYFHQWNFTGRDVICLSYRQINPYLVCLGSTSLSAFSSLRLSRLHIYNLMKKFLLLPLKWSFTFYIKLTYVYRGFAKHVK
jgi:hypothetical protein